MEFNTLLTIYYFYINYCLLRGLLPCWFKKINFFLHFCGLEGARNIILKGYNRNLIISGFPEPSNIAPLRDSCVNIFKCDFTKVAFLRLVDMISQKVIDQLTKVIYKNLWKTCRYLLTRAFVIFSISRIFKAVLDLENIEILFSCLFTISWNFQILQIPCVKR